MQKYKILFFTLIFSILNGCGFRSLYKISDDIKEKLKSTKIIIELEANHDRRFLRKMKDLMSLNANKNDKDIKYILYFSLTDETYVSSAMAGVKLMSNITIIGKYFLYKLKEGTSYSQEMEDKIMSNVSLEMIERYKSISQDRMEMNYENRIQKYVQQKRIEREEKIKEALDRSFDFISSGSSRSLSSYSSSPIMILSEHENSIEAKNGSAEYVANMLYQSIIKNLQNEETLLNALKTSGSASKNDTI